MTQPKWVFSHDDLSVYERADPDEFPDYDDVDSRQIVDQGSPEGPVSVFRAGPFPYPRR